MFNIMLVGTCTMPLRCICKAEVISDGHRAMGLNANFAPDMHVSFIGSMGQWMKGKLVRKTDMWTHCHAMVIMSHWLMKWLN
jgi:hypothetical protein